MFIKVTELKTSENVGFKEIITHIPHTSIKKIYTRTININIKDNRPTPDFEDDIPDHKKTIKHFDRGPVDVTIIQLSGDKHLTIIKESVEEILCVLNNCKK